MGDEGEKKVDWRLLLGAIGGAVATILAPILVWEWEQPKSEVRAAGLAFLSYLPRLLGWTFGLAIPGATVWYAVKTLWKRRSLTGAVRTISHPAVATPSPPPPPTGLQLISGDGQRVRQHEVPAFPLRVRLLDMNGNPTPGPRGSVQFQGVPGSARIRAVPVETDEDGYAEWRGGFHVEGDQTIGAWAEGSPRVEFTVDVIQSGEELDGDYVFTFLSTAAAIVRKETKQIRNGRMRAQSADLAFWKDALEIEFDFRLGLSHFLKCAGEFVKGNDFMVSGKGTWEEHRAGPSGMEMIDAGKWTAERL